MNIKLQMRPLIAGRRVYIKKKGKKLAVHYIVLIVKYNKNNEFKLFKNVLAPTRDF